MEVTLSLPMKRPLCCVEGSFPNNTSNKFNVYSQRFEVFYKNSLQLHFPTDYKRRHMTFGMCYPNKGHGLGSPEEAVPVDGYKAISNP